MSPFIMNILQSQNKKLLCVVNWNNGIRQCIWHGRHYKTPSAIDSEITHSIVHDDRHSNFLQYFNKIIFYNRETINDRLKNCLSLLQQNGNTTCSLHSLWIEYYECTEKIENANHSCWWTSNVYSWSSSKTMDCAIKQN